MKKIIMMLLFLNFATFTFACEVCKKQQPKLLKGVSHGAGPQDQWDYWIVGITALIVVTSLYFSVRWLVRPGERAPEHIKRIVLQIEYP